jgi:hypothetical protein
VTVSDVASLAITIGKAAVCVIEGAVDFMLVLDQDVLADDFLGLEIAAAGEVRWVAGTAFPAALPLFATGLRALGLLGWRRKWKITRCLKQARAVEPSLLALLSC